MAALPTVMVLLIRQNEGVLGLVKSRQRDKVLLPCNRMVSIQGKVDKKVNINSCFAIMQASNSSIWGGGLDGGSRIRYSIKNVVLIRDSISEISP